MIYDLNGLKEKQGTNDVSLWTCMFKTLWRSLLVGGLFRLAADLTGFVAPLGIKTIVSYAEGNGNDTTIRRETLVDNPLEHLTCSQLISNGYIMALVVLLAGFLQSTFSQCSTYLVNSEGIHIKIALQVRFFFCFHSFLN